MAIFVLSVLEQSVLRNPYGNFRRGSPRQRALELEAIWVFLRGTHQNCGFPLGFPLKHQQKGCPPRQKDPPMCEKADRPRQPPPMCDPAIGGVWPRAHAQLSRPSSKPSENFSTTSQVLERSTTNISPRHLSRRTWELGDTAPASNMEVLW